MTLTCHMSPFLCEPFKCRIIHDSLWYFLHSMVLASEGLSTAEAWLLQPVICSEGGIWCGWQAEVHCVCGGGAGQDSCLPAQSYPWSPGHQSIFPSFSSLPRVGTAPLLKSPDLHLPNSTFLTASTEDPQGVSLVSLQAVRVTANATTQYSALWKKGEGKICFTLCKDCKPVFWGFMVSV